MALTSQQHQGLHGEGFVFAMTSSAGLLVSRPLLDVDGVDWLIAFPGTLGHMRSPKIEVQVKTWSSPDGDDVSWSYRMKVVHYNALAGLGFALRRYLLLITVPTLPSTYAICDHEEMRLGHAAYWMSLADRPVLSTGSDDSKTVVVPVPRANLLTPETLTALVAGNGEE